MTSTPRSAPTPGASPDAPGLAGDVERAVAFAGPYLEGLLARSVPTPAVLRALAEELRKARAGRSVAHPELVDPDVYWQQAAWPQAASVVKHARRALVQLAEELESSREGEERSLDAWIATRVEQDALVPADQRDAVRDIAIDDIAARCERMHRTFERLAAVHPDRTALVAARAAVDADCRHHDLLVTAFERALDAIDVDVDAMIAELTAPILGIGERLVRRYDELSVAASIGNGVSEPR
jgi:hypothetical protein